MASSVCIFGLLFLAVLENFFTFSAGKALSSSDLGKENVILEQHNDIIEQTRGERRPRSTGVRISSKVVGSRKGFSSRTNTVFNSDIVDVGQALTPAPTHAHTAPALGGCSPVNKTLVVKGHGCRAVVELAVCEGNCPTTVSPRKRYPFYKLNPTICQLKVAVSVVVPLTDCSKRLKNNRPAKTVPTITLPAAVSCVCRKCEKQLQST